MMHEQLAIGKLVPFHSQTPSLIVVDLISSAKSTKRPINYLEPSEPSCRHDDDDDDDNNNNNKLP